ncbi:Integrase catalytic domain-containing protein [Durusdinium trenchii]|uniref:Integrase catalytic domain-containing protein n=1 Tax=Durusdinium trenchii TaxID=1381693 RepID=A0ABP0N0N3_9DINO
MWRRLFWLASLWTILRVAGAQEDLSCEGYHFDGVDWGSLRRRFEIYADKYLDRPQLLAEEFDLAKSYAFSYSPENRCLLGDLTLRFFLWLAVSPSELRAAVAALSSDGAAASTLTELMQETWTWFWDLPLSWEEILKSGWPLFSILAAVSERVRDEGDRRCESPELAPFVETFDNAIAVSTHHAASLLLEARADCPEATASALVALADQLRTTMWQQPNRYYHFTSTLPERQPKEEDVEILLSRAEALLRPARSWRSLTSLWPFWRHLDRLGAAQVVNVTSSSSWFWMYVFPHRVRSDGIISNRIRGTSQARWASVTGRSDTRDLG